MRGEQKYSNILYGSLLGLLVLQYGITKNPKWLVYIIASILVITIVGTAFRMGVTWIGGASPRPFFKNKDGSELPKRITNGMPSLHTAASSLLVTVLILGGVSAPIYLLALGLLIGVVYFRIAGDYHTISQVIGGIIFGVLLGIGVVGLKYRASLVSLLVIFLLAGVVLLVDSMVTFRNLYRAEEKELPEWFDPTLTTLLDKKNRDSKLGLSLRNFIVRTRWPFRLLVPKAESIRASWKSIEDNLHTHLPRRLSPDVVVGIKSGGAFIAKFIADWYGVPFAYMRVSRYSGQPLLVQAKNLHDQETGGSISEPVKDKMVRGKAVLLVDDTLASGTTLRIAKRHILKSGARSVTTLVYSVESKNTHLCDHFIVDMAYVAWPWGFDA